MTDLVFTIAALVAVMSTVLTIFSLNPVHALLYLIVSLLSVAVIFFVLGAPFAALLEVIVYAGAIMVLFVFVVMMLNLGEQASEQERRWLSPRTWIGPAALCFVLLAEVLVLIRPELTHPFAAAVSAKQVGIVLYGPYLLAVELGSMLLMAGLVAAYHLGRNE